MRCGHMILCPLSRPFPECFVPVECNGVSWQILLKIYPVTEFLAIIEFDYDVPWFVQLK